MRSQTPSRRVALLLAVAHLLVVTHMSFVAHTLSAGGHVVEAGDGAALEAHAHSASSWCGDATVASPGDEACRVVVSAHASSVIERAPSSLTASALDAPQSGALYRRAFSPLTALVCSPKSSPPSQA